MMHHGCYLREALLSLNHDRPPRRAVRRAVFYYLLRRRPSARAPGSCLHLWTRRLDRDLVLFHQRCLDLAPAVAVGWLNAQSIHKKAVAISELISDRSFDVMAVTETWHRSAEDVSLRSAAPPGYAVVDAPRAAGIGGGVAVFYRSHYIITLRRNNKYI